MTIMVWTRCCNGRDVRIAIDKMFRSMFKRDGELSYWYEKDKLPRYKRRERGHNSLWW